MQTADITCLACGHRHPVPNPSDKSAKEFFATEIFVCSECGARMAYGQLLPLVIVKPHRDEKGRVWLRRRFLDGKTKAELFVVDVDPQHAATEAKNILSLVLP